MNTLVLVGLFLVGLVAIVVVVLLLRSESGSENVAAATMAAATTGTTGAATTHLSAPLIVTNAGASTKRLTVPLYGLQSAPGNTKTALPSNQSWSAMSTVRLPLAHKEESYSALLGDQLHELSAELRTLHIRSGEMQQRLGMLLEMADRLEHDQDPGLDFDDTTISPDIPPGR